jgi:hypothetical protein
MLKSGRRRGIEAAIMTKVFSITTQFMKGTVLTVYRTLAAE